MRAFWTSRHRAPSNLELESPPKENWTLQIQDTKLSDVDYFVLDIETTGFSAVTDDVLSAAAACFHGSQIDIASTFYEIVQCMRTERIPEQIWHLTKLSPDAVNNGKPWKDVLFQLISMSANHVWIAHHARHELSFLQRHARIWWKLQMRPIIIDTALVAQAFGRLSEPPTLDAVCQWLDVPIHRRHEADADVHMTSQIWQKEMRLCEALGLETVKDVIDWSTSRS